jgi:hypothetical protein
VRPVKTAVAAALLAGVAVLAAGCGGEDGSSSASTATQAAPTTAPSTTAPATTAPTKPVDAWARRADAICTRYQKQIGAVPPPATEAEAAATLRKTLVPIRKQEAALEKLGPPAKNPTIGLAFIGSIVSTRKALEQILAGLEENDEAKTQDGYRKAGAAGARTRGYAVELGLVHCGAPRGAVG